MDRQLGRTALLSVFWACALSLAAQQSGDPIRVRVTLVPVDVLVTDRHGQPVLDLSREDFEILENGIPQEIVQFSLHAFAEGDGSAAMPLEETLVPSQFSVHRTFLFFMGRGRLNQRFGDVDELIRFVREDMLPGDRVAVMAYHRASDFTTDHEQIARLLERYRDLSPEIEMRLERRAQGLEALYGSDRMPPSLLARISDVFGGAARTVVAGEASELDRAARVTPRLLERISQREVEQLRGEMEQLGREPAPGGARETLSELEDLELRLLTDLTLDDYLQARTATKQDLINLYAAIDYLRLAQGEKHLVYFSEDGLFLPHREDDRDLAARAADARVRFHAVQTGGLFLPVNISPTFSEPGAHRLGFPALVARGTFSHQFALQAIRSVAEFTGGQAFIYESAGRALRSIDGMSRSAYLLAYKPANPDLDGKFRRITVRVHRKNVRVHFRSGYFARPLFVPPDWEQTMIYARTVSAASYAEEIHDIPLEVELEREPATDEGAPVSVALNFRPAEGSFTPHEEGYRAKISIAIFFLSRRGELQHEEWRVFEFSLPEAEHRHVLEEGFAVEGRFVIPRQFEKGWVKIVVYDPTSDRLGLITKRM